MKRKSQSFLHVLPEFFLKSGENSLFSRLFRGLFHHFAQKLAQFRGNFAHRRMEARRKIAVRSTVVRVGQAIFGARSTPDSFYWPTPGAPA